MLVLADDDVRGLLSPADAIAAVAERLAVPAESRSSSTPAGIELDGGRLASAMSVDREGGRAGLDALASFAKEGTLAVTLVLAADRPEAVALVESVWLAGLAAGATSALGALRLARRGAVTVGLIGCGVHAAAQLACLRSALEVDRVVAYCRDRNRLERFCAGHDATPAEHGREVAELDVVVTATTSRDPVLRGDWLRPGSLVCAAGTISPEARELDNVVLERAAFVCCDSVAAARTVAGDLVEPVERGVLDWLEVHDLAEVTRGELEGRQAEDDIVVLKIAGRPALRLALASLAIERAGI